MFNFSSNKYYSDYLDRGNKILNSSIPTIPNIVNIHFWETKMDKRVVSATRNVGDDLALPIVNFMLNKKGLKLDQPVPETKHLYTIGSILQYGFTDATVWGSGFAYELHPDLSVFHQKKHRTLDIRCVRGPKTRSTLLSLGHNCPEIYGDPAVLMPLIYSPECTCKEKEEYLIIAQTGRTSEFEGPKFEGRVVSMDNTYKKVINRIVGSEKVISSSLHGIILAEVYGIPAVFLQNREDALNYKFYDWYESTDRSEIRIAKSLDDALDIILPPPIQ